MAVSDVSNEKIVAALKNPLSLFADRSPGERGSGPLQLTKSGPHERVLASVRQREPADAPVLGAAPNSAAGPETMPTAADSSPEAFSQPLDIGRAPFTPVFYDTPIGYPGTPGTPSGDTPPGGDTPPTTAAPEPAAWALMAPGLFAVAGTLRRQQRKRTA